MVLAVACTCRCGWRSCHASTPSAAAAGFSSAAPRLRRCREPSPGRRRVPAGTWPPHQGGGRTNQRQRSLRPRRSDLQLGRPAGLVQRALCQERTPPRGRSITAASRDNLRRQSPDGPAGPVDQTGARASTAPSRSTHTTYEDRRADRRRQRPNPGKRVVESPISRRSRWAASPLSSSTITRPPTRRKPRRSATRLRAPGLDEDAHAAGRELVAQPVSDLLGHAFRHPQTPAVAVDDPRQRWTAQRSTALAGTTCATPTKG